MLWLRNSLSRSSGTRRAAIRGLFVLVLASAGLTAVAEQPEQEAKEGYAVIVSPDVEVDGMTFDELHQIFTLEKQFWGAGRRVKLLLSERDLEPGSFLLARIYRSDYAGLRRLILGKLYQGEIEQPPMVAANGSTVAYVSHGSGVIAVVPAKELDRKEIKVISIDGKLPGADGYPLAR